METISESFAAVQLRFGFMETPDVPKPLKIAPKLGWQFDIMSTSFFVSRRALKPSAQSGMPRRTMPRTISGFRPGGSSGSEPRSSI
jgi:KUP system potassium uptake protein